MSRYLLICLALWLSACATQPAAPLYHQMDKQDVALANQALAEALQTRPKSQSLTWFNSANRHSGSVTPLRTFRHSNGLWCRDYREQIYIGQVSQQWQDTACRSKAGTGCRCAADSSGNKKGGWPWPPSFYCKCKLAAIIPGDRADRPAPTCG